MPEILKTSTEIETGNSILPLLLIQHIKQIQTFISVVDKEIVFVADVSDGSALLLVEFVAVHPVQDFVRPPQHKSRKPVLQIQNIKTHDFAD